MTDKKVKYTGPKPGGGPYKAKGKKPTDKKKKFRKPAAPVGPKSLVPIFLYLSECCGAPGKKVPLVRSAKDKEESKKSENHLGVFRCSGCNKHSKFTRKNNSTGEAIAL